MYWQEPEARLFVVLRRHNVLPYDMAQYAGSGNVQSIYYVNWSTGADFLESEIKDC